MTVRFFLALVGLWSGVPLPCYANLHAPSPPSLLESFPVQNQGRKKPFLVFANEFLLSVSGAHSLTVGHTSLTAMQTVVALWLSPERWEGIPLLLVRDKPLKRTCKLTEDRDIFSFETLRGNRILQLQIEKAWAARARDPGAKLPAMLKAADEVAARMSLLVGLTSGSLVRVLPNSSGDSASWSALAPFDPRFKYLRSTYISGNAASFEAAVSALKTSLMEEAPSCYTAGMFKIRLELLYQTIRPFRLAWILYLFGGVTLLLSSHSHFGVPSYLCAQILTATGLLCQLVGFICRILIAGRPPVTNMYESVVWFAFGTVFFALLLEQIYHAHFFLAGAIPVATGALFLADRQPLFLTHSIQPLTAVLQSNFWLTTHVLIITLSYAAFAIAMGMGHIALWKVLLHQSTPHPLCGHIYRVLQVGIFLLAVGIFLGGIWANYSWGRFWDWDPKETWALVTLLAYLVLLHGRVARQWEGLGLAIGAIVCFLSVLMAWYGVNFLLGTGLHSYGFGVGGCAYVASAIGLDALFVISAVVRGRCWTASPSHC